MASEYKLEHETSLMFAVVSDLELDKAVLAVTMAAKLGWTADDLASYRRGKEYSKRVTREHPLTMEDEMLLHGMLNGDGRIG